MIQADTPAGDGPHDQPRGCRFEVAACYGLMRQLARISRRKRSSSRVGGSPNWLSPARDLGWVQARGPGRLSAMENLHGRYFYVDDLVTDDPGGSVMAMP